ncbi:MAG: bifunctional phosphopantothenoylcysteine decarboxylase/phosphopantothenate--cysteine ligase CoaBC [Halodesulfurarchaeum sp.]
MLAGTNVVLGVTGSIAAVRVVELAHELRRQGASVRAVMSESASNIVHPWAVEFATGNPVVTEITGSVEHVELLGDDGWGDVFLLAPATANTVGKMAAAIDDSPVTTCATTALGAGIPIVVAPAMHGPMYEHPGVLDSLERLDSWGVTVLDPVIEEGKAKIADEETIVVETARAAGERPLEGKTVVVTSGATAEPVDPIRVLTNRASGKTGRAVVKGLVALGADVTLVHNGPDLPFAEVVEVETAGAMLDAVLVAVEEADALVSAAAISDYTVEAAEEKIRSGQEGLTLELQPTPKLLDTVRDSHPDLHMVGFKAEPDGGDQMVEAARQLQERVDLEFVVANEAGVMGAEETAVVIVDGESAHDFTGPKTDLGLEVASQLADRL